MRNQLRSSPIYFIWRNFLNNGDSWRCLTFTFNSNLSTFQPQCREKLFEVFVVIPVNSKNEEKTWKNQLEAQLLINGIRAHKGADVSSFCNINNHTFTWSNNVEYTLTGSLMRTICMVESDIRGHEVRADKTKRAAAHLWIQTHTSTVGNFVSNSSLT